MDTSRSALVIACGALAREIAALRRANGWEGLEVKCLPPELHNRPERIPDAVREAIREHRGQYREIFVAYADCGTGGQLDQVLREEGIERIPGAHCYEFFASPSLFAALSEAEPGTFYLTDFLLRHFDRLVTRGLGIDRHPELAAMYFGNYRRIMYLSQSAPSEAALTQGRQIADSLGLSFEYRHTGYGALGETLTALTRRTTSVPTWHP
jgi:uncharacterized protein DUF1638